MLRILFLLQIKIFLLSIQPVFIAFILQLLAFSTQAALKHLILKILSLDVFLLSFYFSIDSVKFIIHILVF